MAGKVSILLAGRRLSVPMMRRSDLSHSVTLAKISTVGSKSGAAIMCIAS